MDNLSQLEYYSKNYDKAVRNINSAIDNAKARVIKYSPNADIDDYTFELSTTKDGHVKSVRIFYIGGPGMVDVTNRFNKRDGSEVTLMFLAVLTVFLLSV